MLAADDVALQRALVNLPPTGMQPGENLILAAADDGLHMLQAKLLDPQPVGHHVAHLIVKHRKRHGGVFHEDGILCFQLALGVVRPRTGRLLLRIAGGRRR